MNERHELRIDPSNAEQLSSWDGVTGAYWAQRAERFDEGVAGYQPHLLDAAEIDTTTRVLDIGCGSGQVTRDAGRRATSGTALGVDLSAHLIDLARQVTEREGLRNVTFQQADAQVHAFPEQRFDIAISRSGAMFFGDPPIAFRNIARAIRPQGRVVLLSWQPMERNEWISAFRSALAAGRELAAPSQDAPGPFSLSDPDRVRNLLSSAGFTDVQLRGLHEPMYFGHDPEDAYDFISGQFASMLDDLDSRTKAGALDTLRAMVTDHHTDQGVFFDSAAWLIKASRS